MYFKHKTILPFISVFILAACGGGGGGGGDGGGTSNGGYGTAPINTAPTINNSSNDYSIVEGETSGFMVNASDAEGNSLTYSVSGNDGSKMTVTTSGVVSFVSAPDFEIPGDANGDNIYSFNVSVSDGNLSTAEGFTITVTNDTSDDVVSVSFDGLVIRSGYVQSANVCVEASVGSVCEGSGSTTTSNSDGTFNMTQDFTGALVSNEGFDIVTNQTFASSNTLYLSSPSNDNTNVISPLSNLMHLNDSLDSLTLKTKLNIESSFNIESTDPFSNISNASYEKVARINTQLSILENALSIIDPEVENATTENKTNYKISKAIVNRSSAETSLGDTTFIKGMLTDWSFNNLTLTNAILENLSASISSFLQKVYADGETFAHAYYSSVANSELNPLLEKIVNETVTDEELNTLIFSTNSFVDNADGASFAYVDNESDLSTTIYSVANVGSDYYTVDSINADSTELIIYAKVGDKIVFDPSSSAVFLNHPFELSTTQNDTGGVNNIGQSQGWDEATSTLTVNSSTPLTLYPHCGVHSGMYTQGKIEIVSSFDSSKIDITDSASSLQVRGTVSKGPFKGASGFTHKVYLRQAEAGDNYHTHEFNEYPGLTFYMPADQGYHGASEKTSDTIFKAKSHYTQDSSSGDSATGY